MKRVKYIMVCSPSDVSEERSMAFQIIHEWNRNNLNKDLVVVPLGWKNVAMSTATSDPQTIIDEQILSKSDMAVTLFWSTLGRNDSKGIPYTIGEINAHIGLDKPTLLMFKTDAIPQDLFNIKDRPTEYSELQDFKKELDSKLKNPVSKKKVQLMYSEFSKETFSEKFRKELDKSIDYYFAPQIEKKNDAIEKITDDELSLIETWRLGRIFNTRAEKNQESDPLLETGNVKRIDGISFGLTSFRSKRTKDVLQCLDNGMEMRLLVMNPYGDFIKQREIEENEPEGKMTRSIEDLVKWGEELNSKSKKGKITIKYYNCMTLDFYWRIDNQLYIGPYWLIPSQQTITYKYLSGGKGFKQYEDNFDSLWENSTITRDAYIKKAD